MPLRGREPEIAEFFVCAAALLLAAWPDALFDELQLSMIRVHGLDGPLLWNTAALLGGLVYAAGLVLERHPIEGVPSHKALWLRMIGGGLLFFLWAYTAHVIGTDQWESSLVPIYGLLALYTLYALLRTIVQNYASKSLSDSDGQ